MARKLRPFLRAVWGAGTPAPAPTGAAGPETDAFLERARGRRRKDRPRVVMLRVVVILTIALIVLSATGGMRALGAWYSSATRAPAAQGLP